MSTGTIRFEETDEGETLLLAYSPEYQADLVCSRLGVGWDGDGGLVRYTTDSLPQELRDLRGSSWVGFSICVKHVYCFEQDDLVDALKQEEEFSFRFALPVERGSSRYWKVSGRVLDISQNVLLCADRRLKHEMFAVGYGRWTSVFRKISDVLAPSETEIVVGGDADGAIPWEDFDGLLASFPTTTLLRHYADMEIAAVVRYYLEPKKDYGKAYVVSKRKLAAKAPYKAGRIGTDTIRENFGKSLDESMGLVERQLKLGEGASEDS